MRRKRGYSGGFWKSEGSASATQEERAARPVPPPPRPAPLGWAGPPGRRLRAGDLQPRPNRSSLPPKKRPPSRPSSCSALPIGGAVPGRAPAGPLTPSAAQLRMSPRGRRRDTHAPNRSSAPAVLRRAPPAALIAGGGAVQSTASARRAPSLPALRARQKMPLKR